LANSKIEWTEKTWNPITGCTKISEGCKHCYAERMSKRLAGRCGYDKDEPFKVTYHPDKLDEPLRWRKPSKIFVCSMGDLFHEGVDDGFLCRIFDVMAVAEHHTFLILTKRPNRMREFFARCVHGNFQNIWLGVTAENQQRADERIPILLQIPAAKRFVSVEPMLGPIELRLVGGPGDLDWVICGGETGPGARPMHPDWVRSLRDQCVRAGTPFFFKSWGDWGFEPYPQNGKAPYESVTIDSAIMFRCGKKKTGRLLDGEEWNEYPKEGK
jgi:protein gp37